MTGAFDEVTEESVSAENARVLLEIENAEDFLKASAQVKKECGTREKV